MGKGKVLVMHVHTSSTSFSVACLFSDPTNNLYSTAPINGEEQKMSSKLTKHNVGTKSHKVLSELKCWGNSVKRECKNYQGVHVHHPHT